MRLSSVRRGIRPRSRRRPKWRFRRCIILTDPLDLERYRFVLPNELIARYPSARRDESRLLLVDPPAQEVREVGPFRRIVEHLEKGDLLVFNNARVSRMRLVGHRQTGGRVEALILERTENGFRALLRPLTRIRIGEELRFRGVSGRLLEKSPDGGVLIDFGDLSIEELTQTAGEIPIPPYLKRQAEAIDEERYQTVMAERPGAAAAPTAGLHFTRDLIEEISERGVELLPIHLNVGYGTFAPIHGHQTRLHEEAYEVDDHAVARLREARGEGRRIIAVGTTTVRTLESFAASESSSGTTDLFIRPGHSFKLVDAMITNFHLPESSLLVLVHAFAGEIIFEAYRRAVAERFRFFSYGDAMFITGAAR